MLKNRSHRWSGLRLLLGTTLLVVQLGALTHALGHDLGAPQDQVCLSCLAAQPSGSVPISSSWSVPKEAAGSSLIDMPALVIRLISIPFARQRAPPLAT